MSAAVCTNSAASHQRDDMETAAVRGRSLLSAASYITHHGSGSAATITMMNPFTKSNTKLSNVERQRPELVVLSATQTQKKP